MSKVSKLAPLVVLAVLAFAPAAKAECTPTLSQTFLDWNDQSWYTLATGGSMESSDGWELSKAKIVSGNEPWQINSPDDTQALRLPDGSSATSPFMCVDVGFPYFRFFARNTGGKSSKLKVEVLFQDADGKTKVMPSGSVKLGNKRWRLSRKVALSSGLAKQMEKAGGTPQVAFRFTPMDDVGKWRIDDLYVDPRRR